MNLEERMGKLLSASKDALEQIDRILKGEQAVVPEDRRLLTFTNAADVLGVSRTTIHRMVNGGRLPTVETVSGRRRIPSVAVTNLASGKGAAA
jgi:excisionase family DNA binding protein